MSDSTSTSPSTSADARARRAKQARERRAEKRERRESELRIVAELARHLDTEEELELLAYAVILSSGAAVYCGAPSAPVVYCYDSRGWQTTQYQGADFACRPHRAVRALREQDSDLSGDILEEATVDQRRRAIERARR